MPRKDFASLFLVLENYVDTEESQGGRGGGFKIFQTSNGIICGCFPCIIFVDNMQPDDLHIKFVTDVIMEPVLR